MKKGRLSATVDANLLVAAQEAVERGEVDSVSAWVNDARLLKAEHERRMAALDVFLAEFDAEHGEISDEEIASTVRRVREKSVVVRGSSSPQQPRPWLHQR